MPDINDIIEGYFTNTKNDKKVNILFTFFIVLRQLNKK